MSIDINKAFNFPFKDEFWSHKLLVGGAIFFIIAIIQMLGGFLINLLILAIPIGYVLQSAHNEIKSEEPLLPCWDNKFYDYFKYGMHFFAIKLVYFFILMLIAVIPAGICAILFNIYGENTILSIVSVLFVVAFMAPFVLLYAFIMPFIFASYAENFNFSDAFKLGKIFGHMAEVFPDYLVAVVLYFIVSSSLPFLSMLLGFTCIGIVFIPFIILPIFLIGANIFAQSYKKSLLTPETLS